MDAKFTKGEWVISVRSDEVSIEANHEPNGAHDLICESVDNWPNAHLIAAAPEMYDLLESLDVYDGSTASVNLQKKIDNLLAKARGEL
jgi:hypothetical protein